MNLISFTRISGTVIILFYCILAFQLNAQHFANGLKVGEVTTESATIWTRLTKHNKPLNDNYRWNFFPKEDVPLSSPLPGETPGSTGEVQISYQKQGSDDLISQPWVTLQQENDFVHRADLSNLTAGSQYQITIKSRKKGSSEIIDEVKRQFVTAPDTTSSSEVSFNVITCQGYHRRDLKDGHQIYQTMFQTKPDFFVNTGDAVYYDKPLPYAKDVPTARYKWNRFYAMPNVVKQHNNVSCYFLKDDHDTLKNDAWPGMIYGDLTFEKGLELFEEQTTFPTGTPYRTVRWGKDCQIWLMETRDFRSPNKLADPQLRTIWGKEQIEWLKNSLQQSDATFKFIISATPIVGPDREKGKTDNHANASHSIEGNLVRKLIASHSNTYIINGDRHWQYASIDSVTGLHEFCTGPASDIHARGYSIDQRKPEHTYLKICGGFINVKVSQANDRKTATITHHAVNGSVNYSSKFTK